MTAEELVHGSPGMTPSPEMVEQYRTVNGGWKRADLARWGVPWPPPKGWREDLRRRWDAELEKFLREWC